MLVVPWGSEPFEHRVFSDLVDLLNPGDVLVVNESRVGPARLLGRKPTGAPSEILLLRPLAGGDVTDHEVGHEGAVSKDPDEATLWEALVRPGGKLKPGRLVNIAPGFDVEIVDGLKGAHADPGGITTPPRRHRCWRGRGRKRRKGSSS